MAPVSPSSYYKVAIASEVFKRIASRFLNLSPSINLCEHLIPNAEKHQVKVHANTLDGIEFHVRDVDKLLRALDQTTTGGSPSLARSSTSQADFQKHWSLSASLQAATGIGYREPWRLVLNDRSLQISDSKPPLLNGPSMDSKLGALFGEAPKLKLAALHIAVAHNKPNAICLAHIDEVGVAMFDEKNNLSLTPDFVYHFVNELLFKSIVGKNLPNWVKEGVNIHVGSQDMGYTRIGISVDIARGSWYRVTVTASCALGSCSNINLSQMVRLDLSSYKQINPTISISGTHDLLGGGGWRRKRPKIKLRD